MRKSAEERLRGLFQKHSFPPFEVVIAILEKSGQGEEQLLSQQYDSFSSLSRGIMEILGSKNKDMKTLAKVMEISLGLFGQKFEPIELSESRFSISVPDCPMLYVGKDVSFSTKSRFCDLFCTGGSKAVMDTVLGGDMGICTWDKSLIKGASKCKVVFEIAKRK